MPTTAPPHLVELIEQVGDWKPADLRVERERRLVRNVALTAVASRNGYRYSEDALRQALPLYEDKPVFLDHAVNVARPYDRSARDLVGSIVNPRFEDGRVRGDIRVLDTDAGRTFLGLVESDSPAVGMSHVILAERSGDDRTVERLHDVISVDAVVFPATAATFRESTAEAIESAGIRGAEGAAGLGGATGVRGATGGLPASAESRADEADEARADEPPLAPNPVALQPAASPTWEARLSDTYRNEPAELIAEGNRLSGERDELVRELDGLRQEIDELRAERERRQREQEIERLLSESELPPAVITEVFRRQLRVERDSTARQALVAERQALVRQLTSPRPHSRERPDDGAGAVSDAAFISAVRRRH